MKKKLIPLESVQKAAEVLHAIDHPVRFDILKLLVNHPEGELTVTDLMVIIGQHHSQISQHLALFRNAGILLSRKVSKNRLYYINKDRFETIRYCVELLTDFEVPDII